jgi:Ser/Thr protein kinase RdoA (MazF antagonist)
MSHPLPDNPSHLRELCYRLALGSPASPPSRVHGGLQHRVWRLDTDQGSFAIKQLSPELDAQNAATREHFNTTEAVAEAFAEGGIPAVFALKGDSEYLQSIEDEGYLVHPWREAKGLGPAQISEQHALRVAGIIARMHRMDLIFPGLKRHAFDSQSEDNTIMLVELARGFQLQPADTLERALPTFLEILHAQPSAIQVLGQHLVASHGDLDQKNVLWDVSGNPSLIDWESARRLNPTYEILLESLNWSGIGSQFNPALFGKMIATYRESGGVIERDVLAAAYHRVLGDWVYWLMFNLGRTMDLSEEEERKTGARQIGYTLAALQRIMDHVPELLSVPNPQAAKNGAVTNV